MVGGTVRRVLACLVVLAGLLAAPVAAVASDAELFGALPDVSSPLLSPDGRYLAAIIRDGSAKWVSIRDLDAPGQNPAIIRDDQGQVDWIRWVNERRLALGLTLGGSEDESFSRVLAVNPDGTMPMVLFSNRRMQRANRELGEIVGRDPNYPDAILMTAIEDNRYNLYRVDVMTGRSERIAKGDSTTIGWLTDGAGQARARYRYRYRAKEFELQVRATVEDHWITVATYARSEIPQRRFVGFIGASDKGIVIDQNSGPTAAVHEFDTRTGDLGAKLFSNPSFDVSSAILDPNTGELLGFGFDAVAREYSWRDPAMRQIFADLKATYPGKWSIRPVTWSKGLTRIVVVTEGPDDSGTYVLYDRKAGEAGRLASRFSKAIGAKLSETKPFEYKARDGLAIPAYLTLPRGGSGRNLPLVVMPHGGPEARDALGYDFLAQFMANMGYAVLQPNFRGSSGFGRSFMLAGRKRWGTKMQDDVTDGVKRLIADGIADPARVCIVGWSYGGYAALAGGALTPDLYRCVVSINGVSDLIEMLEHERKEGGSDGAAYRYWLQVIGDPDSDGARLEAVSPARQAGRFAAPVLLVAGEKDPIVPAEQSKIMERALRQAGREVRLVSYAGEDHSLLEKPDSRIKLLRELEGFLAEHLGR